MARPLLSVIIPTYNNQREILMTLVDTHRRLERQSYAAELIVVDGGSADGTLEMANRCRELLPTLQILNHQERQHPYRLVQQGMLVARGRWRLLLPPQRPDLVVEFDKCLSYARRGYEIFFLPAAGSYCLSAAAAETIIPQTDAGGARIEYQVKDLARRFRYRTWTIGEPEASPIFDFWKRLWHHY